MDEEQGDDLDKHPGVVDALLLALGEVPGQLAQLRKARKSKGPVKGNLRKHEETAQGQGPVKVAKIIQDRPQDCAQFPYWSQIPVPVPVTSFGETIYTWHNIIGFWQ